MKKLTTVLLIMLVIATTVFADTDLDHVDFLYLTPMNQALYPELDYKTNPAYLWNLSRQFLLGSIDFGVEYDSETRTRIDDSVGAASGTETQTFLDFLPQIDFAVFRPDEKKDVYGFGVSFESEHIIDKMSAVKYNGPAENLSSRFVNNNIDFGADFYSAIKQSEDMYWGLALGYDFAYDPAVIKWVTDSTVSPAVSYTEALSEPDNYNDYTHGLDFAAGFNFPLDDTEFSVGFDYRGSFTDSSDERVAVDTDGDGDYDTVYKLYDYLDLPSAEGGPDDPVTGKDFVHYTLANNLDLNIGLVWNFEKDKAVIFDGSWNALGLRYLHYAKHVLDDTLTADSSYFDKIYNSSLSSFDTMIAFDSYDEDKKLLFRIGGGYSRWAESLSQNGDEPAGTRVFSSQNTGNYTEMSLGLEPENNALADAELEPAEQVVHSMLIDACWRWTPEEKVTLLLDLGATAFIENITYKAFNLDTRTVWEEDTSGLEVGWFLSSAAGISFPLSENITCLVNLQNMGVSGDLSFYDETHMYDTEIQRFSDNGADYLLDAFNLETKFNVSFAWRW